MAVNKHSKILTGPQFKARSFEELGYAPTMLREQHDKAEAALNENLKNARSAEVAEPFREQFNEYLNNLERDTENLIGQMNTSGINSNSILEDFGSLKRRLDKDFSNTGSIGIATNLNTRINEANTAAMKLAIEQGQSPEDAQRWAKQDTENYFKTFTNDLSKLKTLPSEYRPTLAPKYTDVASSLEPALRVLGKFANSTKYGYIKEGNFEFETDQFGNTYLIGKDRDGREIERTSVDNDQNLGEAYEYLKALLDDDTSLVAQNLKYKGTDVNKLLTQAMKLLGSARTNVENEAESVSSTHIETGGGGRGNQGRSGGLGKEPKMEEDGSPIIMEQHESGTFRRNNKDSMDRLQEINNTNPADLTPALIEERNLLKLKEVEINKAINERAKVYLDSKGQIRPEYQKEAESLTFQDQVTNSRKDLVSSIYNELGVERKYVDPTLDSYISNMKPDENSAVDIGMRLYQEYITMNNGDQSKDANYFINKVKEHNKNTLISIPNKKLDPQEAARELARLEVNKGATDSNYQSFNFSSINAASASKDAQELRNFKDVFQNLLMNGSGGGLVEMIDPKGVYSAIDLNEMSDNKDLTSFIQSAESVNINAVDITPNGPLMRFSVQTRVDGNNQVMTFALPVRPRKNGSLDENTESILDRVMSLSGNKRDIERGVAIKNSILTSRSGEAIAVKGKMENTPTGMATVKSNVVNFNRNGYSSENNKLNYDSNNLDASYYPYNKTNLVDLTTEIVPTSEGNYYATRYKTKENKTSIFSYMTAGNIIETNAKRTTDKGGVNDETTIQHFRNIAVSNTIDKIISKDIRGVNSFDDYLLYNDSDSNPGIVKIYRDGVTQINEKYRKLAEDNRMRNYVNPKYSNTGRMDLMYLNDSQLIEQAKAIKDISEKTIKSLNGIEVATRQKSDLM